MIKAVCMAMEQATHSFDESAAKAEWHFLEDPFLGSPCKTVSSQDVAHPSSHKAWERSSNKPCAETIAAGARQIPHALSLQSSQMDPVDQTMSLGWRDTFSKHKYTRCLVSTL